MRATFWSVHLHLANPKHEKGHTHKCLGFCSETSSVTSLHMQLDHQWSLCLDTPVLVLTCQDKSSTVSNCCVHPLMFWSLAYVYTPLQADIPCFDSLRPPNIAFPVKFLKIVSYLNNANRILTCVMLVSDRTVAKLFRLNLTELIPGQGCVLWRDELCECGCIRI